jgi:O-methyltransferase involved in polyketide biosynthesis
MIDKEKIQKTSSTILDLNDHADVKYSEEIINALKNRIGEMWPKIWSKMSSDNFSAFPVARFHTNQSILNFMAKEFGERLQIVELGAGFTPHFLNLDCRIGKYIEVEFKENSDLKRDIISETKGEIDNLKFISGDLAEEETWKRIEGELNLDNPVLIFSEGVVSQYFDDDLKSKISNFIKPLMSANGSIFMLDDTLRNHPEFQDNEIIKEGMNKISGVSGSSVYKNDLRNFELENLFWKKLLNMDIVNVDYMLSKPEMDFVLENFKLTINLKDEDSSITRGLKELSLQNKNIRVWK